MATKKTATTARFILMPLRGFTSDDMRKVDEGSAVFAAAATNRLGLMSMTRPRAQAGDEGRSFDRGRRAEAR